MILFQLACILDCLRRGDCQGVITEDMISQQRTSCDLYSNGKAGSPSSSQQKWVIKTDSNNTNYTSLVAPRGSLISAWWDTVTKLSTVEMVITTHQKVIVRVSVHLAILQV